VHTTAHVQQAQPNPKLAEAQGTAQRTANAAAYATGAALKAASAAHTVDVYA